MTPKTYNDGLETAAAYLDEEYAMNLRCAKELRDAAPRRADFRTALADKLLERAIAIRALKEPT